MADQETNNGTELLPPNKLRILRNLAWLSLVALAVPFIAILMPAAATFLKVPPDVVIPLVNLSWVLVIFGGFAFLVVSLFSAAVLFRVFNMHDKRHSLGLPRNSIRSLLTFLVFMILMAFIFYSTQIASIQHSTGIATIPYEERQETLEILGIPADLVIGYEVFEENNERFARVTFLVKEESAALEYFDRILIALLGISSTIIGFYFGSRAREGVGDDADLALGQRRDAVTAAKRADESDSMEWSLASSTLTLRPGPEGDLVGVVMVNPLDPAGDREFGAKFVPTEDHDPSVDAATINVTRLADQLTLNVSGIEPALINQLGLEMSVFYRDEEEQAKTLPVEVATTASPADTD